jgi:hypothetical protein
MTAEVLQRESVSGSSSWVPSQGFATGLTDAGVKTAAYAVPANKIVRCDAATIGAFAVTLPTLPADGTREVIKKIDSGSNAITVNCGGSAVFNKTGGSTSITLPVPNMSVQLQYIATGDIWSVVSTDSGAGVAYLASPALTGTPTAPTPAPGDNSTLISTTAFVAAAIAAVVNSSPVLLDTLKELADSIADDPNFAATMTAALGLKAPLASPALTGTPTVPTAATGTSTTQAASTAFVQAQMAALLGGPSPAWPSAATATAYTLYQLPTGGLGYLTATRTTRASFDATERAFWVFIPGRHFEQITSGTTWTCPTGIAQARFRLRGGGGGGGGGGSAATGVAQTGGGGGGAGAALDVDSAVTATTVYTLAIGAGGVGGSAGAAGGNPGGNGGNGGDTTLIIGGTTYTARGGGRGLGSGAGVTTAVSGGHYGNAGGGSTVAAVPGQGGASAAVAVGLNNVSGGSGGGTATTTLGGNNGNARTAPGGAVPTPSGNSVTSSGVAGTSATELGCGGGGGGGGTNNTGAGGAGGAGNAGQIKVWF